MHSCLITGATQEQRLKKAKQFIKNWSNNPDLLIIESNLSIGINQIRQIQKFLSRKPYEEDRQTVVLPQAQLMTIPAQNAFLKTLEEPPVHSQIILCAPQKEDLLPTIISRCQVINLVMKKEAVNQSALASELLVLDSLMKTSPGQRIQLIEAYAKNREMATSFCQQMILTLRQQIKNGKNKDLSLITYHLSLFIKTIRLLQSNINVKLALENLALNFRFSAPETN